MNEGVKTAICSAVAIVVACIAYFTRPVDIEFTDVTITEQINKPLFPEFKDPKAAARLEVVQVKPDVGTVSKFEVARDKKSDLWTIPSHSAYPADAENQMRDVSLMFVDLEIRGIASTVADDHSLYGVLEPEQSSTSASEGTGMLVTVEDRDGGKLAGLIIGKSSKDSTEERFVRKPGQDVVYVVAIDPAKLSTKFEDWIEKDLLQLNAWDIENVSLLDYSIVETNQPGVLGLDQRLQVDLKWEGTKSEWQLGNFLTYQGREAIPTQMAPDESLNTAKLNELKTALDDLAIVDVLRKPKGMTADLRADQEFLKNNEAKNSLDEKGFFVVPTGPDTLEIKSANGEIHVAMKDGVKYILRFGDTMSGAAGRVDRFMFVTAQFDESRFPLPEPPAGLTAPATTPPAAPATTAPGAASPGAAPATDPKTDKAEAGKTGDNPPANAAEEKKEGDKNGESVEASGSADLIDSANGITATCEQEGAATPAAKQDPPAAAAPAAPATQPATPGAPPSEPPGAAAPADAGAAQPTQPPSENEAQAAERERLLKDYQRQLDDRKEKIDQGKQRVRELNGRFADWYYVISEDLYRKIHLGRADIFERKPGTAEEGVGIESFRKLEKEGLKKPQEGASAPGGLPEGQ